MSQFGGNGPLPPGRMPPPPPFRPQPNGFQPNWPGRQQGFPPPLPGSGIRRRFGLKPGEIIANCDLKTPGLLKMAIVGSLLQFITIGIYRFWFLVNLRRQLWQRSSFAGSPFEYTGTPGEIFRGFLVALIFLAPIWAAYAAGSTLVNTVEYREVAGVLTGLSIVAFMFFSYFAIYRGRRYRVSRTLWRGVRFRQTGSGILYALMNFGWWLLVLPTLGLSIPFARAQLERYRINHMWFGNRQFESKASGRMMIGPFLLYYAAIFGPILIGVILWVIFKPANFGARFDAFMKSIAQMLATQKPQMIVGGSTPATTGVPALPANMDGAAITALVLMVDGYIWLILMPIILWPLYRACELRRFIGRISFGATRFRSTFSAAEIYICYIIFGLIASGAMSGIGILAAIVGGIGFGIAHAMHIQTNTISADVGGIIAIVGTVLVYLLMLLAFSVLRIRMFLFELTSRLINTVIVDGIDHLQDVVSQSDLVGAVGDDFAGGFDIGAI